MAYVRPPKRSNESGEAQRIPDYFERNDFSPINHCKIFCGFEIFENEEKPTVTYCEKLGLKVHKSKFLF